jgi:serine protease
MNHSVICVTKGHPPILYRRQYFPNIVRATLSGNWSSTERSGIVRTAVAALLGALAVLPAGTATAQDITPQQVRRLLEQNVPERPVLVPGEVIVKMVGNVTMSGATLSSYGLEAAPRRMGGGEYIYRIPPTIVAAYEAQVARDSTWSIARRLNGRPDVEYAHPNYILYIADRAMLAQDVTPNDPRFSDQWHYLNNGGGTGESPGGVGLPQAWDASTGDASVVVGILDTGILPGHPDIAGSANLLAGFDMITDPSTGNDGDGRDNDPTDPGDAVGPNECFPGSPALPSSWHGTHVAGTVGVGITNNGVGVAGINWNAGVLPVRVLGKCGASTSDINDAIRWAAGLPVPGVPNNPTPARVINMSLGTPPGVPCSAAPSTQAAINDAVAAGAAVVVAAGNDAVDASQVMPASCNNVITVAASDARGRLVTRYSNFGTTIEIMAPGGDVNRDDSGDGNPDGVLSMVQGGYAYYNGTSMAAPHVAGVAALWLATDPTLTPAQVLAELEANALPRSSTECPELCGAGLLNAVRGTTPPVRITVVLDPDRTLATGETTTARATVTRGGTPQAGMTVSFSTDDPTLATVAPSSVVTNSSGIATATVTAVARGETTVFASVNGITASTPVRVPTLSAVMLALLVLVVILTGLARRRRDPATR